LPIKALDHVQLTLQRHSFEKTDIPEKENKSLSLAGTSKYVIINVI
jgi:hypothetical protein